jgi:membrane protein CcdC involved in cytochrome C biogenesis
MIKLKKLRIKIPIPRRAAIYMKRKSKTEKLLISLRLTTILIKIFWNDFHDLASLNTFKSLIALKEEIAPLVVIFYSD